jgi:CHAD domain-containing protein
MQSDELKRYFRKRINTVIREFSRPVSERTEETFHRLRVEIKKIKALYELINSCDKKFQKKKSVKVFKEVFDAAGKVRNLHIEENMVADFGLTKSKQIISGLHRKQTKAIRKFEKVIGRKLIKQIQKNGKKSEDFLKNIKEKELDEYFEKSFSKIEKLVSTPFDKRKLHNTRMQLKEFLYNLKLELASKDKLINNLDNLQEAIGNWHDYEGVIAYIDKLDAERKITSAQLKHLKSLRAKLSRKSKLQIQKINQGRLRLKNMDIKSYVK